MTRLLVQATAAAICKAQKSGSIDSILPYADSPMVLEYYNGNTSVAATEGPPPLYGVAASTAPASPSSSAAAAPPPASLCQQ